MEKPTFIALERSLVGNDIVDEGTAGIVLPEGTLPGPNMQPENDAARALVDEYNASNDARVKAMMAAHAPAPSMGDPAMFAQAVAAAVSASNAQHAEQNAKVAEMISRIAAAAPAPAPAPKAGRAGKAASPDGADDSLT